jgi:hypothetical protein
VSTPPASLDDALMQLQADPPVLLKNRDGQVGNQKTRYADLTQVNREVLARLNTLGVAYICRPHLDGAQFGLHYRLVHVASGEHVDGVYPLRLSENPQQMGSAITYARRYVLLALTGVAAEDEDDDGTASRGVAQRARPAAAAAPATNGRTAQRSAGRAGPPPLPGEDGDGITDAQQRKLHAVLRQKGVSDRDTALGRIGDLLDRPIDSTRSLSRREAARVIDALEALPDGGA